MGNLKNFYYNHLDLKLSNSEYWDFYLTSDETCLTMYDDIISGTCFVAHYDFNEAGIFGTGSNKGAIAYSQEWNYFFGCGGGPQSGSGTSAALFWRTAIFFNGQDNA